jgi:hypothetical protein
MRCSSNRKCERQPNRPPIGLAPARASHRRDRAKRPRPLRSRPLQALSQREFLQRRELTQHFIMAIVGRRSWCCACKWVALTLRAAYRCRSRAPRCRLASITMCYMIVCVKERGPLQFSSGGFHTGVCVRCARPLPMRSNLPQTKACACGRQARRIPTQHSELEEPPCTSS